MATYQAFTSSRTTVPDPNGLLAALRTTVAPDVGITVFDTPRYTLKKTAPWAPAEIAAAQTVLDTAAVATPQLTAQHEIDVLPIWAKAIVLALIDQLNIIRAALPTPLPAITPAQAITAIRNKAATLT